MPLRVMWRRNPIIGKRLGHILIYTIVLGIPKLVMVRKKVTCELKRNAKNSHECENDQIAFPYFHLFWSEIGSFDVASWISYEIPHKGSGCIGFHRWVTLFCKKSLEIFQRYNASIRGILVEEWPVHLWGTTEFCSKGELITGRKAFCTFSS